MMREWIDTCATTHGSRCKTKHVNTSEFKELIDGTYFGVIDITTMQLKALPTTSDGKPERYVALSYVWGKEGAAGSQFTTTRLNVMKRIQSGGLKGSWDVLPRTIQDVFLLLRKLKYNYLWIDSLCIVQDSSSSWELNAKAMHLVYGNAHFTICAADGDAKTGLRAVNTILRSDQADGMSLETILEDQSTDGPVNKSQSEALVAECLPGVRLLVSRPSEAVLRDSLWSKRGWTLQERLLSRRCLVFAQGQVYFQCRSAVMSQEIFTDGNAKSWSLDMTNSPLRYLGELQSRAFWFYMACVRLYTDRALTKQSDVLSAFEGISRLLERRLNAPLFFGLPSSHLDLALLWTPIQVQDRRRCKFDQHAKKQRCRQDEHGYCNCKVGEDQDRSDREFPSWSWCGWVGGKVDYQLDMLDGPLLNVREWLLSHTWILWYTRDAEGNLRPLWDRRVLKEDSSENCRWKGYAGRKNSRGSRHPFQSHGQSRPSQPLPNSVSVENLHRLQEAVFDGHYERDGGHGTGPPPTLQARPLRRQEIRVGRSAIDTNGRPEGSSARELNRQSNVVYPQRIPQAYHTSNVSSDNLERRRPNDSNAGEWSRQSNAAYLERLPQGYYDDNNNDRHPSTYKEGKHRRPSTDNDSVKGGISKIEERPHQLLQSLTRIRPYEEEEMDVRGRLRHSTQKATHIDGGRVSMQLPPHKRPASPIYMGGSFGGKGRLRVRNESDDSQEWDGSRKIDYDQLTVSENESDKFDEGSGSDEGPSKDDYGRHVRSGVGIGTDFESILPENPFGVACGPFLQGSKNLQRAMPILQFWTWRMELYVNIRSSEGVATASSILGEGLCRCDIVDDVGDWCGSIVLSRDWIQDREGYPLLFVAISDAKNFTNDECTVWNYYIPKEKDESNWDLYFVLLLDRNQERALWERVRLGKVFQAAFGEAVWDEIKLG